ncbi:hypothetical protein C8R44DRAFT_728220 [Mycena epipterygia]|nr:hypothetical protein C8R44DRAFT_728220 [Mycena epipterygia]
MKKNGGEAKGHHIGAGSGNERIETPTRRAGRTWITGRKVGDIAFLVMVRTHWPGHDEQETNTYGTRLSSRRATSCVILQRDHSWHWFWSGATKTTDSICSRSCDFPPTPASRTNAGPRVMWASASTSRGSVLRVEKHHAPRASTIQISAAHRTASKCPLAGNARWAGKKRKRARGSGGKQIEIIRYGWRYVQAGIHWITWANGEERRVRFGLDVLTALELMQKPSAGMLLRPRDETYRSTRDKSAPAVSVRGTRPNNPQNGRAVQEEACAWDRGADSITFPMGRDGRGRIIGLMGLLFFFSGASSS